MIYKHIFETSYPKIDITENMFNHTVEYWQLSISLCQFLNFRLHVTGKSYQFFRFKYLEMCYSLYTYIYMKLRYITAQEVPFLEFFSLFLTKHLELAQFFLFCNGTFTILMLNFSIEPTDITLTLLKCCETVTSGEVNPTENITFGWN